MRAKGNPIQPSTCQGGLGFAVLHLHETSQAEFSAQAKAITEGSGSDWLFQGARILGFEKIPVG
ncbi:MAG: hypothetical protein ACKOZW_06590 [Cyanobium sp.]